MNSRVPRPLRVLIVDDNEDHVESMQLLLEASGHVGHGVRDGPSAILAVAQFDPDVMLLDIRLPGPNGWDVAREVRKVSKRRIALIAISGEYVNGSDRALGKMVGFDHYLVKPVNFGELDALLRRYAGQLPSYTP